MKRIRAHLSYANVVASLALFIALGGISWAAVTLPKNSVGAKQIRKNAVLGSKIKASAVTSGKVKNGSLLAADFKAGQLPRGEQGPAGPAGTPGAKGDTGPAGPVTGDLPSGATLRGIFNVDFVAASPGEIQGGWISFPLRLSAAPAVTVIPVGGPATADCPGSVTNPQAAAGHLCVYENSDGNANALTVCNANCDANTAERHGAELYVHATAAARSFIDGSWAVTAS